MSYSSGLALTTILMLVMFAGFSDQVSAQEPRYSLLPEELTVNVCTEFTVTVEVEINDPNNPLVSFRLHLFFDPNSMGYVSHTVLAASGWTFNVNLDQISGDFWMYTPTDQPPVTETRDWLSITFHCLEEGDTIIASDASIKLQSGSIYERTSTAIVHQVEPAPVGGVVTSINKLEIIAPYLALAGLMIAVSAVFVIKKRKD